MPGVTSQVLSMHHPTAAATAAWIRVVAHYDAATEAAWLVDPLRAIGSCDPRWATPWMYGALMARRLGDAHAHDRILSEAMALHPLEPWFPWAFGMARLEAGDRRGASTWLRRAADLPGAPQVHAAAADALDEASP